MLGMPAVMAAVLIFSSYLSLRAQSVTNGLKAYLNFDNNLNAQGPTTINGSAFSGTARYTTGKFGSAVRFLNNASPYTLPSDWAVSLGNLEGIYSNSFSVSLWVKSSSTADAAFIGNKDWVSGANIGWVVATTDGKNINWNTSNGYRGDTDLNPPMSDGNWHLVTITVDRTANKLVVGFDLDELVRSPRPPPGRTSMRCASSPAAPSTSHKASRPSGSTTRTPCRATPPL